MRAALLAVTAAALAALVALLLAGGGDDDGPADGGGGGVAGALPALGQDEGNRINEIYERVNPGVVFIQAQVPSPQQSPFGAPGPQHGVSTGTGFVLDREGFLLTNAHVVEGAREIRIRFEEDALVRAELVGSDLSNDLALLKVDPGAIDVTPLELGSSADVQVGDPVIAIGNPFGLTDTVTSGIVSALQRRITAPNGFAIENVIQTDAAVNPGNSGGPLLDFEGRVIGINSQIATGGGAQGNVGIAFAVPVDIAKEIIPDLKDDGRVERPFLGVSTITVSPPLAQQLGLGVEEGALVVTVAEGSAAAEAGLRAAGGESGALTSRGDVIVRVGDTPVTSSDELAQAIGALDPGANVEIEYVRGGERETVDVELGVLPPG